MGLAANGMTAAAVQGGFASLCSQAAVGLANNKGDLLATLQGLASDQGLRALASAMLTASLTNGLTTELAKYEGIKEAVTAGGLAGKVAQDAVIGGTVQAGVGTALYGGDLGQNLLNSLRGAAVDSLGADLATRIGNAAKNNKIDNVSRMIAHAALGGAMAAADGKDAASGALGAVVGEITAEQFVKGFINDQLEDPAKLKNLSPDELKQYCKDVDQLKQRGVDLSKLSAGLAAALVGGDVNTAAQTGGNAAQHNELVTLSIFLELVDKGLQAYDALRLAKAIDAGNHEEALDIAQEISIGLATDFIPGNVILAKIGLSLNKFGLVGLGGTILRKLGGDAVGAGAKFAEGKLARHFADHGADFGAKSPVEYEKMASQFMTSPKVDSVLEKVRASGDIVRYNPRTQEFGVLSKEGYVRTYYKPDPKMHSYKSNLEYFNAQK